MKRNMNLIQKILLKAQEGDPNGAVAGFPENETKYHKALAIEAGFLRGKVIRDIASTSEVPTNVVVQDITWTGHDFLDMFEGGVKS
jgi:hypothetical protein